MSSSYFADLTQKAPEFASQVDEYFSLLRSRWYERGISTTDKYVSWSKENLAWLVLSRIQRSEEVSSQELDQIAQKAWDFHGRENHHFMITCMDGRNLPVVMMSMVPRLGGAIRTRAGELFSFVDEADGSVFVDEESFVAKAIAKLVSDPKRTGHTIYYSFDSHLGCAAKSQSYETLEGGQGQDGGLVSDIRRKIKLATAIDGYVQRLKRDKKAVASLVPLLFSYNPHDGVLWMGLELFADTVSEEGLSDKVLSQLLQEGKVVSTLKYLRDPEIVATLESMQIGKADFREDFLATLQRNWDAITALYSEGKGALFTRLVGDVRQIYLLQQYQIVPLDSDAHFQMKRRIISEASVEHKAKLLLKNLVTRWSIARNDESHDSWPYGVHDEQGVVITEGGYAPFPRVGSQVNTDTFAVFSKEDSRHLIDHVKLALRLVRGLRKNGTIEDPLRTLTGLEFVAAPILVKNHEIVRGLSEETWRLLETMDSWKLFASIDWRGGAATYVWDQSQFSIICQQLLAKETLPIADYAALVEGMYSLFVRMRSMMLDAELRSMILNGNIVVVHKLLDHYRRPRVVMPMVV